VLFKLQRRGMVCGYRSRSQVILDPDSVHWLPCHSTKGSLGTRALIHLSYQQFSISEMHVSSLSPNKHLLNSFGGQFPSQKWHIFIVPFHFKCSLNGPNFKDLLKVKSLKDIVGSNRVKPLESCRFNWTMRPIWQHGSDRCTGNVDT
jgi:hypothetical protein